LSEVKQATVASRLCPDRRLGKQAAHHVAGERGEGVAVGVDADHAVDGPGQPAHRYGSSLSLAWSCRPEGHHAAHL
jgi:hypothetical protein